MKNALTPSEVSAYYYARLPKLQQRGQEWRGTCPIHDGKNPNFAVDPNTGTWFCHSKCQRGGSVVDLEMILSGDDFKAAVAHVESLVGRVASGPEKRKIVATYDYVDETGKLLSQAVRYEPKGFSQRRPDGHNGWIHNMQGVRRVLYRLPNLKEAEMVVVVEGEKDVQSLERLGYTATCNAEGAGKWRPEFGEVLRGKSVVVIPDQDEPGEKHAQSVVKSLLGKAKEVRLVQVQNGKDVTDWISAGATKETIDAAIAAATPEYEPGHRACSGRADATLTGASAGAEVDGEALPEIVVTSRQLRELRAEAMDALQRANTPPRFFARENSLVDIRSTEQGRKFINVLTDVQLRGVMSDTAQYFAETKDGLRPCPPPLYASKDILGHAEVLKRFPSLIGTTEIPVLRPDGTVLLEFGYDAATGLYYSPSPGLVVPAVPEQPTESEIIGALNLIDDCIGDFPFVVDLDARLKLVPADERDDYAAGYSASKANALGLLLTSIVRPVIAGPTPLALIDAPAAGTGKTLLAEVVAKIATGRSASLFSAPVEEEEWRKQVTSYLREGVSVVVIDNVWGQLDSAQLAKALTAETWADRLLGFNKNVIVPVRCTWMATGNNIVVGGDLPRRCYWIRLDAKTSRPYRRTGFKHPNLRKWIGENRGALIAALLTLARAWFAAGKPQLSSMVLGSYEAWTETIGGILEYVGVRGFLGNAEQLDEQAEVQSESTEKFLVALQRVTKGERFTSADVHQLCLKEPTASAIRTLLPPEVAEAIGQDGAAFERRLGKWFSDRVDARFGEAQVHVRRAGVIHKSQLWIIFDRNASWGKQVVQ